MPDQTAPVHRHELKIDVSAGTNIPGPLHTAVSVVAPNHPVPGCPLLVALPGAGYGRGYYDVRSPAGYSQAEHHAARGIIVAACDHLGVGDSSIADRERLTLEGIAAANHATARTIVERLRSGTLAEGMPSVEPGSVIGMGQSMGGCLLIIQQALFATFDAVAVLGFSAVRTVLPAPGGGESDPLTMGTSGLHYAFHWEDVPPEVAVRDMDGYPVRRTPVPWGSATIPEAVTNLLEPGFVAREAAAIDAPVFVAAGERDVIADLHAEPAAYRGSTDVTIFQLPRSAHMHNFASTRVALWDRLVHWMGAATG